MKRIILILVLLIIISGCTQLESPAEEKSPGTILEEDTGDEEKKAGTEIACADYDGNQEACLLYNECEWIPDEDLCDPIGGENEEEIEDEDEEEDEEEDIEEDEDIEDTIEGDKIDYVSPWTKEEGKRVADPYFFDVSIVELDDGRYRMYGEKGADIESYISNDGISWEKENGIRLSNAGFPFVMKTPEGKWRLFYVPSGSGMEQDRFLSAISSDGINFAKESGERYKGESNLEEKIQGPRIIQLDDKSYRMYFTAMSDVDTEHEISMILSAVSDDGLNFAKEEGIRLDPRLKPFVGRRVAHAWPVILDNGDVQLLFAGASTQGGGILSAVSGNGLDFTVNPFPEIPEDVIEEGEPPVSPQDACVISMNGLLRMYYGIYKGPDVVPESAIYSAVSP